jgi:hypothetical protein
MLNITHMVAMKIYPYLYYLGIYLLNQMVTIEPFPHAILGPRVEIIYTKF